MNDSGYHRTIIPQTLHNHLAPNEEATNEEDKEVYKVDSTPVRGTIPVLLTRMLPNTIVGEAPLIRPVITCVGARIGDIGGVFHSKAALVAPEHLWLMVARGRAAPEYS